jgi:hypothetical protein
MGLGNYKVYLVWFQTQGSNDCQESGSPFPVSLFPERFSSCEIKESYCHFWLTFSLLANPRGKRVFL